MMQRALANEGERESAPSVGDMAKQIDGDTARTAQRR
jgi:hypothetical protein